MITFIARNLGTIITGLVVLITIVVIIIKMIKDYKKGKCFGCNEKNCQKSYSCK